MLYWLGQHPQSPLVHEASSSGMLPPTDLEGTKELLLSPCLPGPRPRTQLLAGRTQSQLLVQTCPVMLASFLVDLAHPQMLWPVWINMSPTAVSRLEVYHLTGLISVARVGNSNDGIKTPLNFSFSSGRPQIKGAGTQ